MNKGTIGLDEAGRGALAGKVYVGACFLPAENSDIVSAILGEAEVKVLKDSKKLSKLQRERIFEAPTFYPLHRTGWASPTEIDRLGIVKAIELAAGRAIDSLRSLIDIDGAIVRADAGLFHPYENEFPTERFIKGDENYPEIAFASIAAKVGRDHKMSKLATIFPGYGFEIHAGYGTSQHLAALRERGPSPVHRKLFIRNVLKSLRE